MHEKQDLPKSISEEIFDRFFELIDESELFSPDKIEQLKDGQKKNELTKTAAIEDILNSSGGEQ